MDSAHIKAIVALVNAIDESEDYTFTRASVIQDGNTLLDTLISKGSKSQTFVAAIAHHLIAKGFKLNCLDSNLYTTFEAKFGKTIEAIDERSLQVIKKISSKLFN